MFTDHKSEVLIATPLIEDDIVFRKSVVYLCQNDKFGALGLIINKTLPEKLKDVFKQVGIDYSNTFDEILEHKLFMGGTLNTHKILIFHSTTGKKYKASIDLSDGLSLTTSADILEDLANNITPEYFLPVVGFSSWSDNQLKDEIKANDWMMTTKIDKDALFRYGNKEKWVSHVELSGVPFEKLDKIFNKKNKVILDV